MQLDKLIKQYLRYFVVLHKIEQGQIYQAGKSRKGFHSNTLPYLYIHFPPPSSLYNSISLPPTVSKLPLIISVSISCCLFASTSFPPPASIPLYFPPSVAVPTMYPFLLSCCFYFYNLLPLTLQLTHHLILAREVYDVHLEDGHRFQNATIAIKGRYNICISEEEKRLGPPIRSQVVPPFMLVSNMR